MKKKSTNKDIFFEFLEKIKKNSVVLQVAKKIDGKTVNLAMFDEKYIYKLGTYKSIFLKNLNKKRLSLILLKEEVIEHVSSRKYREILLGEIDFEFEKMNFLELTYDIAAHKFNSEYTPITREIDYEHFNKIFWNTSLKDLEGEIEITEPEKYDMMVSKADIIELLNFAKTILPDIKWKFGSFPNFAFNGGWFKITDSDEYHIKDVLSLFFHEFTHFFRFQNTKRNLNNFFYSFSDYSTLEEGIAIYNEFYYSNQVINYGEHNPFYDKCFQVLLSEFLTEEEKIEKITQLLAHRGYDAQKSKDYYDRFYKFAPIGSKNLYLKDLVYTKSYKTVKKLLDKDKSNYDKIMAGRVGIQTMKLGIIPTKNNLDAKIYFEAMVTKLREFIEEKNKSSL